MTALPAEFAEALARLRPRLGPFAQQLLWYPEVTSTNDIAARLADTGAAEGTVVAADAQTAGRGRHGRVWISPPGAGLYVSLVLRPDPETLGLLTLAVGVAVSEGIERATGLETHVKWPNDVYVGDRKVAGILAEAGAGQSGAPYVIVGVGVNVTAAAYPPDVASRATSIEVELGRTVDRGLLLATSLAALADRYAGLQRRRHADVLAAWRGRAALTFGRRVEWDAAGSRRRGVAEDLDERGALLVRTESGIERIISGEIRWT